MSEWQAFELTRGTSRILRKGDVYLDLDMAAERMNTLESQLDQAREALAEAERERTAADARYETVIKEGWLRETALKDERDAAIEALADAERSAKNWDYKVGMEHWRFSYEEQLTKTREAETERDAANRAFDAAIERERALETERDDAIAALREIRPVIEALCNADANDRLSIFKVEVPKDGYPRQYLMDYLPTALAALTPTPAGGSDERN